MYVHAAVSSSKVFFTHCALRLKRSGTVVPRMELVEDGPSMDLVVRRHRLSNDGLRKEAMKLSIERPKKKKKKVKNISNDVIKGKIGNIYMPDQQVGEMKLSKNAKGLKRERREGKKKKKEEGKWRPGNQETKVGY